MKLIELVEAIDAIDDDQVIYVSNSADVNENSEVHLIPTSELLNTLDQDLLPDDPEDTRYFLEVYLAKEAIDVLKRNRNGTEPSTYEKYQAIKYYAENDAYL